MYESNLEKLKLVLQNLEKATEHLKSFIEKAEMPEAIMTLLYEEGNLQQDFLASVLGVGVRELNDALLYLKTNKRISIKGKIGTSGCIIESKEPSKEEQKEEAKKGLSDKDGIMDDLKKLEDILTTSKEQY